MALADHDRLDKKLDTRHYTHFSCGSLNVLTGQAEYCGYDCPTLKARMASGEDPGIAMNPDHLVNWDPTAGAPPA